MSQSKMVVDSIVEQYKCTFTLLRRSIECFNAEQWIAGISQFEIPCHVAYHTLQCLVYYFRAEPEKQYREIPPKYGKDWWQLSPDEYPSQRDILAFLDEVSQQVLGYLSGLNDANLGEQFGGDRTVMLNIMYASRHTMHHQGGLNVLSVHHGIDVNLWDS